MLSPIQLTPNMDKPTMVNAINAMMRQIESENRTKVITDESGVPRILIGRRADGKYGIRVSEDGVNVNDASNDQLILNSDNNLFNIVKSGELTLDPGTILNNTRSDVTSSFDHGLDYVPNVIAFITFTSPQTQVTQTRLFGTGKTQGSVGSGGITVKYISDETVESTPTSVIFRWGILNATGVAQAPGPSKIKYYLLTETAT